jgi:hypothetical protein
VCSGDRIGPIGYTAHLTGVMEHLVRGRAAVFVLVLPHGANLIVEMTVADDTPAPVPMVQW